MEEPCFLMKQDDVNAGIGKGKALPWNPNFSNLGFLSGEWRQKAAHSRRRKTLSEITNRSIDVFPSGVCPEEQVKRKIESPKTANEYIAVLLEENNALMRALVERNEAIEMSNAEVQRLRLMVTKISQQNYQLSQTNSVMLAEINMAKDRLKVAQHELGCQSAALRAQTLELEELKEKFNKQDKLLSKFTSIQNKEIKPVESTANDACHSHLVSSHTKQCSANRKRTHRSRMLGPMPITSPTTRKEKDGNSRKTIRRKSVGLRAESCEPNEDLFEIPLSLGGRDDRDSNDDDENLPRGDGVQGRRSIGRPLRKAAERVNSYKELPLKAKLRRSE